MINTSLSCVAPIVQLAGEAALKNDAGERDEVMQRFKKKVELLVDDLKKVDGVSVFMPAGTFYVFPARGRRSASVWASPRTAWPCSCLKAPTTAKASPVWGANVSAAPARASYASAAPNPTIDCTRP